MKFDPKIPLRKPIRLKGYDYSQAGGYFVTIVSYGREYLFGEVVGGEMRVNALGRIVQECYGEIPIHFPNVEVDAFVVMPNHIHGIIFIHENDGLHVGAQHAAPLPTDTPAPLRGMTPNIKPGSLGAIVRSFKSAVTRRAVRELNSGNIWQRNYYEHILRASRGGLARRRLSRSIPAGGPVALRHVADMSLRPPAICGAPPWGAAVSTTSRSIPEGG